MNAFPGQRPGERYVSKKAHIDGSPQPAAKIVAFIKIGARTSYGPAGRLVLALAFVWSTFELCIASYILFFANICPSIWYFTTKKPATSIWPLPSFWQCKPIYFSNPVPAIKFPSATGC